MHDRGEHWLAAELGESSHPPGVCIQVAGRFWPHSNAQRRPGLQFTSIPCGSSGAQMQPNLQRER